MHARSRRAMTAAGMVLAVSAGVLPAAASTASTQAQAPAAADPARASRAAIVVNTHRRGPAVSPLVLGSNHRFPYAGYFMWDREADRPVPRVVAGARRAGIKFLRYPGGSRADMFDWKEAIGPIPQRGCQVFGRWGLGKTVRAVYGIDEHMRFAAAVGARTIFTVPIANESAGDAADLVEYMNTPVGKNPNGGIAWAEVRARNGHRAPYGVQRWSIGNEPYLRTSGSG